MGLLGLLKGNGYVLVGKVFYEQWKVFMLGGEAVLEAITPLLVSRWYFLEGMRSMPKAHM